MSAEVAEEEFSLEELLLKILLFPCLTASGASFHHWLFLSRAVSFVGGVVFIWACRFLSVVAWMEPVAFCFHLQQEVFSGMFLQRIVGIAVFADV